MKMKKMLSLILTLSVLSTSFLPTVASAKSMDLVETRDGFEQLKEKHGLGEINLKNVHNQDLLEFESLEEFEQFIVELKKPQIFEQSINLSNPATTFEFQNYLNSNINLASTKYNDSSCY